jgi:glycosyltransferase involved in cell wall biosynthesis
VRLFSRPYNASRKNLKKEFASAAHANNVSGAAPRVAQVLIYVNSDVETVRACLAGALESFAGSDFLIICDSSEEATCNYLANFAAEHASKLVQNLDPLGYQRSVAKGIQMSEAQYLVVVDSDVVATAGCLRELAEHLNAVPQAEVAVPLLDIQLMQYFENYGGDNSSAAGFVRAADSELIAAVLDSVTRGASFTSTIEGFVGHPCFALRRTAFSKFAAWKLAHADSPAAASVSLLAVPGTYATYRNLRPARPYAAGLAEGLPNIASTVDALQSALARPAGILELAGRRVLFLLPSPGGGGGAHSVVQEVAGLRRCGLDARIANVVANHRPFEQNYPEARSFCFYHANDDELLVLADGPTIAIATNYASVASLRMIVEHNPSAVPLYYVQDYEPWFYPEQGAEHHSAKASYTLVPKARAFAKTEWLCQSVHRLAGIEVAKIDAGLDRSLYNGLGVKPESAGPVALTAMIRPSTPRRNPQGTLSLLRAIKQKHGGAVDIRIFGCSDEELDQLDEARGFDFVNFGELKRAEVAEVLRGADIFIDLSTSQSFGCTGLEAMAVGCATVLPRDSGVEEYATNGHNCLLVNTTNIAEAVAAVERIMADNRREGRIKREALQTGLRYSVRAAVWSLLVLFARACETAEAIVGEG